MAFKGNTSVYQYLMDVKERRGAGFLVLMDPDRFSCEKIVEDAVQCFEAGVDALLMGTSLMMGNGFAEYVEATHEAVDIPVIIFPGEKAQVTEKADAILFLSLLSGRNPEYIIGEQIRSAPLIKNVGLEAISTAYLLIDSGQITSVEFMSNTKPIPSDKPDIAVAHAIAAEMFGMKLIYLEAGSGASRTVPDEIIRAVISNVDIPVIVGGGIRNPETVAAKVNAGASFIVVGNHLENNINQADLKAFVKAAQRY
ncbi:MAG TPA: geranylgeranylglyceryl/heptaprenylglyceryl phosphate synthase [Anaerolineae bacterium]|nr:geranylgeranylglyceryl/heptaprenylglyceryl phosphate synthase [Anaerolineae bacterium]